jgi:Holliday junction resolvase
MGKFSRAKGNRVEREMVIALRQFKDVECIRTPLSGAYGKFGGRDWMGDLKLNLKKQIGDQEFFIEVKSRATDTGFSKIKEWLGVNHFLIIKENLHKPLIVMKWHVLQYLLENVDPKYLYPPKDKNGQPVYIKQEITPEEKECLDNFIGEFNEEGL